MTNFADQMVHIMAQSQEQAAVAAAAASVVASQQVSPNIKGETSNISSFGLFHKGILRTPTTE